MDGIQDLTGHKRGKVVANDDPKGKGKVRVEIEGITKGMSLDAMPWFSVGAPAGLGGSPYSTEWKVPQINTSVIVVFTDTKSIYSGVVLYTIYDETTIPTDPLSLAKDYTIPEPSETHFTKPWPTPVSQDKAGRNIPPVSPNMLEDYPFSWGWVDPAMNWMKVNLIKRTFEFVTNTFLIFKIFGNGDTVIKFPKNVRIVIQGDLLIQVEGSKDEIIFNGNYQHVIGNDVKMVEGTSVEEAKAGKTLQGRKIRLN